MSASSSLAHSFADSLAGSTPVSRRYRYAVVIGRFQPVHEGHRALLQACLDCADQVVVVIGSDRQPRSFKNPFTVAERSAMVRGCLEEGERHRVRAVGVVDDPYDDQVWIDEVRQAVEAAIRADGGHPDGMPVALVGHVKDDSSYYLHLFPGWDFVPFANVEGINATDVRMCYFGRAPEDAARQQRMAATMLPASTGAFLQTFRATQAWEQLADEREYLLDYRRRFRYAEAGFAPIFCTVDAVVVQRGHVLLVQRGRVPGQGNWALPGGFLEADERLLDGALRELREETALAVPDAQLRASLWARRVFDAPDRSQRGRVLSHAHAFVLPDSHPLAPLPAVQGRDDAAQAAWWPVEQLEELRDRLFEDHYFILKYFLTLKQP